jgi:hypothetical protein
MIQIMITTYCCWIILPKKSKLRYQKELEKWTQSEVNERETFIHW